MISALILLVSLFNGTTIAHSFILLVVLIGEPISKDLIDELVIRYQDVI